MSGYDPAEFGIGRLFHLTSEAIVVADLASEQIVLWNDAAQRIFGYTAADTRSASACSCAGGRPPW